MGLADTYNIRSAQVVWNSVANAIEDVTVTPFVISENSVINIASGVIAQMGSLTQAVTVAQGECVKLDLSCNISQGTAGDHFVIEFQRDGVSIGGPLSFESSVIGTDGVGGLYGLSFIDLSPSVGAHTYRVGWARSVGLGTVYSAQRIFNILCMQKNA